MSTNEFLLQPLQEKWFSTIVWSGILRKNITTVQSLRDFITKIDRSETLIFGEKSLQEIKNFLEKNNITLSSYITSTQQNILWSNVIIVN